MATPSCVLCRIAARELPVDPILETDHVIGFLTSVEALALGHCVFFPKRHVPNLHEVDDTSLSEILLLVKKIAAAMGIETYNVLQNNGALAGQTVFHAHVHLIPKRSEAEGLRWERGSRRIDQTEIARRLKAALADSC